MKGGKKEKLKGQAEFSGGDLSVCFRGNEISGFRLMPNANGYNNTSALSYEMRLSGVTSGLATAISSAVSQMPHSLQ